MTMIIRCRSRGGGQPFVATDGAPVARDPGQGVLGHPLPGQDLEGVQVTGAIEDLEGELERGLGPGDQLACVVAVGPGQLDGGKGLAQGSTARAWPRRGPARWPR
jgi:hypothetical protein